MLSKLKSLEVCCF